ncbi:MAG: hypothetical protein M3362_05470 [Acidobacteriota bacterium]|nr:hypothetical protein [Acidobacteriota bacterium]
MTQEKTGDPETPPASAIGDPETPPSAAVENDVQAFGDPETPPKDTGGSGTTPAQ